MRVALVAPLREGSPLATTALLASEALAESWDVEIWFPACDRPAYTPLRTTPFVDGARCAQELAHHDLAIYVLGDDEECVEVFRAARRLAGLVILHDATLTRLAAAADTVYGTKFLLTAAEHVGPDAVEALAVQQRRADPDWDQLRTRLPMTQVALQNSLGVVTHSALTSALVEGQTAGAVSTAALPVRTPRQGAANDTAASIGELDVLVPWTAADLAHVVDLIAAVAESERLRERVRVRLVGVAVTLEQEHTLARAVVDAGLVNRVKLVRAAALRHVAFGSSTVIVAVGAPALPGVTRLLVESMARGSVTVVPEQGHFPHCPEGTVVKVEASLGSTAWVAALERILTNPIHAAGVGAEARRHMLTTHTAAAYAEVIVNAADSALRARFLVEGIRDISRTMAVYGLSGTSHARELAAAAINDLFGPDYPTGRS